MSLYNGLIEEIKVIKRIDFGYCSFYHFKSRIFMIQNSTPLQKYHLKERPKKSNIFGVFSMTKYSPEFKLNVLNYMKTTGVSYSITANHFGISDIGTIANWNTKFLRDGIEAFFKPKGRPQSPMTKAKQSKQSKTLTREQQLEEENK